MMAAKKAPATAAEQKTARERDLDLAYTFLIPPLGGRNLTPKDEREGRKAVARLLSAEGSLDRGLRKMLAAIFDPDPFQHHVSDGLITVYPWLASERIIELKFRKKRRTPPVRYQLVGLMIARHLQEHRVDIVRQGPGEISVECAIRDVAKDIGMGEETVWNEWSKFLDFIRRHGG